MDATERKSCWPPAHRGTIKLGHKVPANQVLPVWYPVLDENGDPIKAKKDKGCLLYTVEIEDVDLKPRLITATAALTEMAITADGGEWWPKAGAAIFVTESVQLFRPNGVVRIIGHLDYSRELPIGIMLHLGFSK